MRISQNHKFRGNFWAEGCPTVPSVSVRERMSVRDVLNSRVRNVKIETRTPEHRDDSSRGEDSAENCTIPPLRDET